MFLELKIVKSSGFLKRLVARSAFFGLLFSLMLSWTIGLLFGASGLIVMIAAIVSTPITEMFHSMRRKKDGAKSKVTTKIEEVKSTARELWDTWSWVVTILKYAVLIVTSPLWIPMVIRRKFKQHDDPSSYTVAA